MAMLNNQMVNKAQIFHGSFRPRWLNGVAGHISEWWDVMRDRPIFCTFLWAWAGPTLSCCHSSCCQTRACPWCGDATLSPSIFECQRLQVAAWAFPLLQQWPKETSVRHICGVEPGCHVCCFSEQVPPPAMKGWLSIARFHNPRVHPSIFPRLLRFLLMNSLILAGSLLLSPLLTFNSSSFI